jgi:flagellar protein FlaG
MTVDINLNGLGGIGAGTPYRAPDAPRREPVAEAAASAGASVGAQASPRAVEAEAAANTAREQTAVQQEEAVRESVDKLNEFISPYVTSLKFSVDKDTGKFVVKILDTETKEVIKQFPSEKILALAKALAEAMGKPEGLLVEQDA